jgi:hypothetical protein
VEAACPSFTFVRPLGFALAGRHAGSKLFQFIEGGSSNE